MSYSEFPIGKVSMHSTATRFERQRSRLLGLAYRMLGSLMDAEDIVQDAWFKWSRATDNTIKNDQAYLTTVVSRMCLDKLKHEKIKRDAYTGPWLPEPITDTKVVSALTVTEYADDISYAFMVTLEKLTPLERAAFLLHDIFDIDFKEIADIINKEEPAVRQLASRARKALKKRPRTTPAPIATEQKMLHAFYEGITQGSVEQLKSLLREDAVFISDGGGKRQAALKPIVGRDKILRLLSGLAKKFPRPQSSFSMQWLNLNGRLGIKIFIDQKIEHLITIDIYNDTINSAFVIRNPEKLSLVEHHV